jgi:hypothetical protein
VYDGARDGDDLLVGGFEIACLLSHRPQVLNRIHQLFGLIYESFPKGNGPREIRIHFGDHLREPGDGFYIVVPRLGIQFGNVVGVLYEARGLHDFKWID